MRFVRSEGGPREVLPTRCFFDGSRTDGRRVRSNLARGRAPPRGRDPIRSNPIRGGAVQNPRTRPWVVNRQIHPSLPMR